MVYYDNIDGYSIIIKAFHNYFSLKDTCTIPTHTKELLTLHSTKIYTQTSYPIIIIGPSNIIGNRMSMPNIATQCAESATG